MSRTNTSVLSHIFSFFYCIQSFGETIYYITFPSVFTSTYLPNDESTSKSPNQRVSVTNHESNRNSRMSNPWDSQSFQTNPSVEYVEPSNRRRTSTVSSQYLPNQLSTNLSSHPSIYPYSNDNELDSRYKNLKSYKSSFYLPFSFYSANVDSDVFKNTEFNKAIVNVDNDKEKDEADADSYRQKRKLSLFELPILRNDRKISIDNKSIDKNKEDKPTNQGKRPMDDNGRKNDDAKVDFPLITYLPSELNVLEILTKLVTSLINVCVSAREFPMVMFMLKCISRYVFLLFQAL